MSTPIKFYTKEETRQIKKLFKSGSRTEQEQYAKAIGRTWNEIRQKAYYEQSKNSKAGRKLWSEGEINFVVNNWGNMSMDKRKKYAESIGRTYKAIDRMYYYKYKEAQTPEREPITITTVERVSPLRMSAVIKIGDVTLELPDSTHSLEINGNKLVW